LAIKKETTEGTAVKPDVYLRITEEGLAPTFPVNPVQEISGDRHRNIRSVRGQRELSGDIGFFVEPKQAGHFFTGVFGAPTTQVLTASTTYRHVWDVKDTLPTYTIDVKPADAPWCHRFFGVKMTNFELT
jgi:hypothetical protein